MKVRCVDASGQPRLVEDAVYEVVADVQSATVKGGANKSGYIVKLEDDRTAIPYLYNRTRFVAVFGEAG